MRKTSWIVNDDNSRSRQMGDRCFYCPSAIGAEHAEDCVIRLRTVVVRLTIETIIAKPEDWSEADINFHLNESSSCASNLIHHLDRLNMAGLCFCDCTKSEYLREATRADHLRLLPGSVDLLRDDQ